MNIVFVESLGMCECTINKSLATLKNQGHTVTFYHDRNENEEVLIERARNAEVVVVSNIPLRKHFFENCPKLRMLSVAFTGVDHIDLEACKKRGITVCNAAGYSTEAVAELTIGMMIAVYRKMVGGDAILRIGGDRQGVLGSELYGKTVGIVGLGAIGQRVALLANAFGCKVLGYNRSPKALPHITTARGPIVSQEALYNALKKGQIAGAAVDVYDQEPPLPLNLELFNAPNLLMLPHMGYATREAFETRLGIVVRNIEMWLSNTPQNQVL